MYSYYGVATNITELFRVQSYRQEQTKLIYIYSQEQMQPEMTTLYS
jgi:hypothetical protein